MIELCDPGALGALNKGQSLGTAPAPLQTDNAAAAALIAVGGTP